MNIDLLFASHIIYQSTQTSQLGIQSLIFSMGYRFLNFSCREPPAGAKFFVSAAGSRKCTFDIADCSGKRLDEEDCRRPASIRSFSIYIRALLQCEFFYSEHSVPVVSGKSLPECKCVKRDLRYTPREMAPRYDVSLDSTTPLLTRTCIASYPFPTSD